MPAARVQAPLSVAYLTAKGRVGEREVLAIDRVALLGPYLLAEGKGQIGRDEFIAVLALDADELGGMRARQRHPVLLGAHPQRVGI